MYSNAAGIIPVVEALLGKGAALGTVLAFMMNVIALSLPEMEIIILGPECAKCNKTEKLVREVIDEIGVDAKIEKVSDMMQIASYGVFGTPSVIIDNKVMCTCKMPKKNDIKSWLIK
jgi:small redox-active disulfide protein 2